MSSIEARVRRLEEILPSLALRSSPAAAWAAIVSLQGVPKDVVRAGGPCLPELRSRLFFYARRFMRAKDPAPPDRDFSLRDNPFKLLSRVLAYPPGQGLPENLVSWRKPRKYDPETWQHRSRGYATNHLFGYGSLYKGWVVSEIAWLICPKTEALELRRQLHTSTVEGPLDPPVPSGSDLIPWPEGLFALVDLHFHGE